MEINKFSDIRGVVANEDIVEGRMGFIAPNLFTDGYNYGSRLELPGVSLPTSDAEAALSKFVVTWRVPDQTMPMYLPEAHVPWALRKGFDRPKNLPLTSTTVHLTWPGSKHGETIPSGQICLAFAGGVFTFPSGHFVESSDIRITGNPISVEGTDAGADQGKPEYSTTQVVGYVEFYDADEHNLTVRTLNP
jgi:hypothetical protein